MSRSADGPASETAQAAVESSSEQPASESSQASLEDLAELPSTQATAGRAAAPTLRVARLVGVDGKHAKVTWRGGGAPVKAEIAPEVDDELMSSALADKQAVLVELADGQLPLVVAVLATRLAREVHVKADTITIEAEREVLLRSGRAALRLREDGDVELLGSRISAASRGLFRLVGRILRLN